MNSTTADRLRRFASSSTRSRPPFWLGSAPSGPPPYPGALVHPWLTADGSPTRIRVHLGDQPVGHLPTRPGTTLIGRITAAAARDQALTVDGLLTGTGTGPDPWVLRVTVPRTATPKD